MARARERGRTESSRTTTSAPAGWPAWADPLAVDALRDALRADRIGHAYLLSGPSGVGKADLARAFCQALCCTNRNPSDPSTPCGTCRACRAVNRGGHPDVEWFTLETQALLADKPGRGEILSIDSVRRLRGSAALRPVESARRILIVDDAETMLEPAQQALLKTLEEPPPAVTLLLLTDEPEALLETVRSRCQQIVVRPVPAPVIEAALVDQGVDLAVAAEIARLSRGCPAWAMAAAGDQKVLQARRSEWDSAVNWLRSARYERLVTAFRLGDQFSKRRVEVYGVVQAAIQVLRDEMIGVVGGGPQEAVGAMVFDTASTSPLALSQAIRASLQCLVDLDANVRPRLALEAMVLAWPNSEARPT